MAALYATLILGKGKDRRLCDKMGPLKLTDVIHYFHHAGAMEKAYSNHVAYLGTCPPFWRFGICKHAVALTVLTSTEFELPGELDERSLEKHDNARASAKAFAVGVRKREVESRKQSLLESDDEEEPQPKQRTDTSKGGRIKKV